jgi:hypothetical protein
VSFTLHTAGANPLVPIVAPDIVTYVDLKVTCASATLGTLSLSVAVDAEIFVAPPPTCTPTKGT